MSFFSVSLLHCLQSFFLQNNNRRSSYCSFPSPFPPFFLSSLFPQPFFSLPSTCLYPVLPSPFLNTYLSVPNYRPHTPFPNAIHPLLLCLSRLCTAQHSTAHSLLWKTCWRVEKSVLLLLLLLLLLHAGIFLLVSSFELACLI